jgi:hypothetical protein
MGWSCSALDGSVIVLSSWLLRDVPGRVRSMRACSGGDPCASGLGERWEGKPDLLARWALRVGAAGRHPLSLVVYDPAYFSGLGYY